MKLRFTLMSGQSCIAHRASWDSFPDDEETIERSAEAIRFARFLRKYSVPAIFLETNRIRAMRSKNSIDICIGSSLDCVRSNERRNIKGLCRYFLASNVLSASSILKKIKVLLVPLCHLLFSPVSFKYVFNMLQSVQIDSKLVITSCLHYYIIYGNIPYYIPFYVTILLMIISHGAYLSILLYCLWQYTILYTSLHYYIAYVNMPYYIPHYITILLMLIYHTNAPLHYYITYGNIPYYILYYITILPWKYITINY